MKRILGLALVSMLALAGCNTEGGSYGSSGSADAPADAASGTNDAADDGATATASDSGSDTAGENSSSEDGPSSAGTVASDVALSPENTKIQFVGTHTGDKPDPRNGHFTAFSGSAQVEGGRLKGVRVEIDTASLTTDIEKLTNHLKSPDFFDVNQYPKASFQSTSIENADNGQASITGDLTLHGVTKSITFPATVSTDGGLVLDSEFQIDRTEFGMDYGLDNVEKLVSMNVTVGK